MSNERPSRLANPVWQSLHTSHAALALTHGEAARYPADVAPFGAVAASSPHALRDLRTLLTPGESVWVMGSDPAHAQAADLSLQATLDCHRMVLPLAAGEPEPPPAIDPLSCTDAAAMVALTDVAFPGFFRPRTCEMGAYFGIRSQAGLLAMAGERMGFPGFTEISGLCTHPAHRGQGFAARLLNHLTRRHRSQGIVSFLHVATANQRAISLYRHLGFQIASTFTLHRVAREA